MNAKSRVSITAIVVGTIVAAAGLTPATAPTAQAGAQNVQRYGSLMSSGDSESFEAQTFDLSVFAEALRPGALTFTNYTAFDFGTAGLGTTTFSRTVRAFQSDLGRNGRVHRYSEDSGYGSSVDYAAPAGMFDGGVKFSATSGYESFGSSSGDLDKAFVQTPEPSTWIAGVLAIAAAGYMRRRRASARA